MDSTYLVTFDLGAPVIMGPMASFDGLLAWCAVQQALLSTSMPDYDKIHNTLPLRKIFFSEGDDDNYVYGASNFFVESGKVVVLSKTYVNKMFPIEPAAKYLPGYKQKINLSSGLNRSYRIPFTTLSANQLLCHFSGDADAVEKLLRKWLRGIGKKTNIGFGVVKTISIEIDATANPLIFPDGEAKRVIPVYAAAALGVTQGLDRRAPAFYRPPYAPWHPERRVECIIPNETRILGGY